ncbi:hypothetical protein P8452_13333 [Trifolium repens]|nr:hypothetical protein P8452_13333 [Trifolium repens]
MSLAAAQNPSVEHHHERIIIPNKHDQKLVGILHQSGPTTTQVVILCHGVRSSKDTRIIVNLAVALEKAQISSFRFDFSGNGESEGSFENGFWTEVDDLHSVIQHFRESNRVVRAIVGHSKGGVIALLYASKYHDVKTIVNLSGRYNLQAGIEERLGKDYLERIMKEGFIDVRSGSFSYRVTEESLMELLGTNMHEACPRIDKECRVLTIHGSSDEINSVQDAREFAKIIPNHKLHIIEGADHAYNNHQDELSSVVVSFIKTTID